MILIVLKIAFWLIIGCCLAKSGYNIYKLVQRNREREKTRAAVARLNAQIARERTSQNLERLISGSYTTRQTTTVTVAKSRKKRATKAKKNELPVVKERRISFDL